MTRLYPYNFSEMYEDDGYPPLDASQYMRSRLGRRSLLEDIPSPFGDPLEQLIAEEADNDLEP